MQAIYYLRLFWTFLQKLMPSQLKTQDFAKEQLEFSVKSANLKMIRFEELAKN